MLTIEMLNQNAALSGLTDEQKKAVAEMSKNDEQTVIGTRIGELHGQYDKDILDVTGIKKNDGEKSYDYTKRVLNHYKTSLGATKDLETKLEAAEAKVTELNQKIASGDGDEAIRQQLKDAKAQVTQLQNQMSTNDKKYADEKTQLESKVKSVHVDYAFAAATSGLKFKAGIPESVQRTMLEAAKNEVLAKGTPDFNDDGNGGKTLVIRGADGNILNNVKNNLNPYTIKELVMETSLKDIIDVGKKQAGAGTGTGNNRNENNYIDLSGAKNQVEADKVIADYLLSSGLTRDSVEFAEQSLQLRNDNEVSKLPLR